MIAVKKNENGTDSGRKEEETILAKTVGVQIA